MGDAWRCTWWQGWSSSRKWPTSLRPCRWHTDEANCVCFHPELYEQQEVARGLAHQLDTDAMSTSDASQRY